MADRIAAAPCRDVMASLLLAGLCTSALGGGSMPNGLAAGDTTSHSAVLWTRSTALGSVVFEYSTDATFGSGVTAVMRSVVDGSVPVKAEIGGLAAGTRYYYRATDANRCRWRRRCLRICPVS